MTRRQADRTTRVGNKQIAGMQRPDDIIKGRQLLAFSGLADHDGSIQQIGVVGMDRLSSFQHHVVGDVHWQRDRPHACQLNAPGQPERALPRWIDAGHTDRDEQRAGIRLEAHSVALTLDAGTGRSTGSVKDTPVACADSRASPEWRGGSRGRG